MARVTVRYGGRTGRRFSLETNDDLVVVRTATRARLQQAALSSRAQRVLAGLQPQVQFLNAGVEVLACQPGDRSQRDTARRVLNAESGIDFAGRVLSDSRTAGAAPDAKDPVLYTENLFVTFAPQVKPAAARATLAAHRLTIKRPIPYLPNAYFVAAPKDVGLDVFALASMLLDKEDGIELCHPELIRLRQTRRAFPRQWHLFAATIDGVKIHQHAHVRDAWKVAQGEGTTIAIIDDGVDVGHEELASRGKIVAPWDAGDNDHDPRPGADNNHGTACAGVACADGVKGASGVAPRSRLLPIRLWADLGSQAEADAFAWAADHGADVISCSWGPTDGAWWDPLDPMHDQQVLLPDSTRLAIDYAVRTGRGGRGCVICWAAGNGNESVDNDGYASHPSVIAVAACNDRGRRSIYSDYGEAIWCAFPSNDFADQASGTPRPRTTGIWTTDRTGHAGYNPGGKHAPGDKAGHYTNAFGGTSSAAPGVAGVAALVLSCNPNLSWTEVRDVIKASCDRIDAKNGRYGATGHSKWYGYGRINALKAVKLAVWPSEKKRSSGVRRARKKR